MSSTLDIKVNFNAIPEYARSQAAEQTGMVQRSVNSADRAREENLRRSRSVPETDFQEAEGETRPIQLHQEQTVRTGRKSRQSQKENLPFETYTSAQTTGKRSLFSRARGEENIGNNFNFKV